MHTQSTRQVIAQRAILEHKGLSSDSRGCGAIGSRGGSTSGGEMYKRWREMEGGKVHSVRENGGFVHKTVFETSCRNLPRKYNVGVPTPS